MTWITRAFLAAILLVVPTTAIAEPELAPPPRVAETHVRIEKMVGGYQVILTRKASENLRDALAAIGDGQPYTELAKLAVKELNDPEAEKKINLLAFVVKTQAPSMKKALDEKMGPNGAIIKVFGVENKNVPEPPPIVKAIGEAFLPADIKDKVQTGLKVLNTTPLFWRVEGQK
ncbi:MAG: hypothetical protein K8T89_13175 [Planctomycetes bacterium]|nr:hypothetical protein [Planctomycetota bacterium]